MGSESVIQIHYSYGSAIWDQWYREWTSSFNVSVGASCRAACNLKAFSAWTPILYKGEHLEDNPRSSSFVNPHLKTAWSFQSILLQRLRAPGKVSAPSYVHPVWWISSYFSIVLIIGVGFNVLLVFIPISVCYFMRSSEHSWHVVAPSGQLTSLYLVNIL